MAYGSSKTGIASGNRTPCLRKLIPALLSSSHSKPTIQRTHEMYIRQGARGCERDGLGHRLLGLGKKNDRGGSHVECIGHEVLWNLNRLRVDAFAVSFASWAQPRFTQIAFIALSNALRQSLRASFERWCR